MNLSRISVSTAAAAILACGIALWPVGAQPPAGGGGSGAGGQPPAGGRGQGRGAGQGGSKWRETYKTELAEHPSLGRALVALHDAKDYLELAKDDLGGHKATAIKACDDTIKELTETLKFDPKRDPAAGRGQPADGKPADAKPGDAKPPTPKP